MGLTFMLYFITSQVHVLRKSIWSILINTVSATSKVFPKILLISLPSLFSLLPLTYLRFICRERDFLVPSIKQRQCNLQILPPICCCIQPPGLTSLLSLSHSFIYRLPREWLCGRSYQMQPVPLAKSFHCWCSLHCWTWTPCCQSPHLRFHCQEALPSYR